MMACIPSSFIINPFTRRSDQYTQVMRSRQTKISYKLKYVKVYVKSRISVLMKNLYMHMVL